MPIRRWNGRFPDSVGVAVREKRGIVLCLQQFLCNLTRPKTSKITGAASFADLVSGTSRGIGKTPLTMLLFTDDPWGSAVAIGPECWDCIPGLKSDSVVLEPWFVGRASAASF